MITRVPTVGSLSTFMWPPAEHQAQGVSFKVARIYMRVRALLQRIRSWAKERW